MSRIDVSGQKFGRLTAIKFEYRDKLRRLTYWSFKCDCGVIKNIHIANVIHGNTKSCGCLYNETVGTHNYKHGSSKSNTYHSWNSMRWRCGRLKNYNDVFYCKEWESYESFLDDMGERPEGTTLDRIDGSKGYDKSNCCWVTKSQQCMNTKKQKKISTSKYKGVDRTARSNKFRARIGVNHKRIELGMFDTQEEAALAYNEAAIKYFGEYAALNSIVETTQSPKLDSLNVSDTYRSAQN